MQRLVLTTFTHAPTFSLKRGDRNLIKEQVGFSGVFKPTLTIITGFNSGANGCAESLVATKGRWLSSSFELAHLSFLSFLRSWFSLLLAKLAIFILKANIWENIVSSSGRWDTSQNKDYVLHVVEINTSLSMLHPPPLQHTLSGSRKCRANKTSAAKSEPLSLAKGKCRIQYIELGFGKTSMDISHISLFRSTRGSKWDIQAVHISYCRSISDCIPDTLL